MAVLRVAADGQIVTTWLNHEQKIGKSRHECHERARGTFIAIWMGNKTRNTK